MTEAEKKIEAIRAVLNKRADVLHEVLKRNPHLDAGPRGYYEGKLDGYNQALALLGESLESIRIEL